MATLTVLVPVYNEQHLVTASLERLAVLEQSPLLERLQVIVIDDSSRDRTAEVLADFARARGITLAPASPHAGRSPGQIEVQERGAGHHGKTDWLFLRHARNGGKGAAVRSALARAEGAITVFHDADLEYHPRDLLRFLPIFIEEQADAVFGSRFAGGEARRALLFRHELGNRLLTFLTNLVTNVNLTDMETCYKAVRTSLLRSIPLLSDDFRLEPELTIKLAKREARIFEVPISYSGRTYQEGKKIGWRDGFRALAAILRFWWSDHVYQEDEWGSQILGRLARAPRFNAWMADTIRPFCGQRVLEIGSGTGNLTRRLIPRDQYVASEINPLYLQSLQGLTADRPYLDVTLTDVTRGETFPRAPGGFDTVVCLNVVEHVDDDVGALRNIRDVLAEGGRAIVLVPQGPEVFGTLDEVLGHRRRYTVQSLGDLAAAAGFTIGSLVHFNRVGRPAWWLNGRLLRRRDFGLFQIMMLNLLTPLFRLVDRALPFDALSLIAVMEKVTAPGPAAKARGAAGETGPAAASQAAGTNATA
jgi:glycosyltransferase involved in cell wall biosynthesis/phospholipid N-methyltransferase